MAKADIGEVQKLVVVGDGFVAAIGSKGTVRFNWMRSHSHGRVDETDDIRVNAVVRHGFMPPNVCSGSELADALPVGAVIPLPSEKRARTWMKQDRGPKQDSRWHFESAIQAGFRPRYYLGEDTNPYESGTKEHSRWVVEKVYLARWAGNVLGYAELEKGLPEDERKFLKKIPDWQTRVLVAWMIEDEFNNGEWKKYEDYPKRTPLV